MFDDYLAGLPHPERRELERTIELVSEHVPEATEGLSYGFPAFRYHGRPLLGFGEKAGVLSLYPFDPRVVSLVAPMLTDFEVGKGYVRFRADRPVPDELVLLMVELRLERLEVRRRGGAAR